NTFGKNASAAFYMPEEKQVYLFRPEPPTTPTRTWLQHDFKELLRQANGDVYVALGAFTADLNNRAKNPSAVFWMPGDKQLFTCRPDPSISQTGTWYQADFTGMLRRSGGDLYAALGE